MSSALSIIVLKFYRRSKGALRPSPRLGQKPLSCQIEGLLVVVGVGDLSSRKKKILSFVTDPYNLGKGQNTVKALMKEQYKVNVMNVLVRVISTILICKGTGDSLYNDIYINTRLRHVINHLPIGAE